MTTISDEELYTGLHAFVFIKEVDPGRNIADVVDEIADPERFSSENGQVLFASVAVGSYIGFAHVRADDGDLAALQRFIYQDLWAKGVGCEHAVEGPRVYHDGRERPAQGAQAQEPAVLRPGAGPDRRRPGGGHG